MSIELDSSTPTPEEIEKLNTEKIISYDKLFQTLTNKQETSESPAILPETEYKFEYENPPKPPTVKNHEETEPPTLLAMYLLSEKAYKFF